MTMGDSTLQLPTSTFDVANEVMKTANVLIKIGVSFIYKSIILTLKTKN